MKCAPQDFNQGSAISIDLEVDNLAACVDTNGASFVVNDKPMKFINQGFKKSNTAFQSIKNK